MARNVSEESRGNKNLIDVGSGLGHLSRLLSYGSKFSVVCVDEEQDFTANAKVFDADLVKAINKKSASLDPRVPVHLTFHLDHASLDLPELESKLGQIWGKDASESYSYGIVGLHTCGDLGPLLAKLFVESQRAVSLQSVGCCYMKVDSLFPLSNHVKGLWHDLTYTARELACHAMETYIERLKDGDVERLKVHCYRALLEKLLCEVDKDLRHSSLKTVSKAYKMDFEEYARLATSKMPTKVTSSLRTESCFVREALKDWWKVVALYSLRLSFAPLIETMLLLDRAIYIYENGHDSSLTPVFEPKISPRNHILLSIKK